MQSSCYLKDTSQGIVQYHTRRKLFIKTVVSLLCYAMFMSPMECTADESSVANMFKDAYFDFSDYKPEPGIDDFYTVYHIIPSGTENMNYHESACNLGIRRSYFKLAPNKESSI